MCGDFKLSGKDGAKQLARLMEKKLGFYEGHIDPVALSLFLRSYWSRVTTLAHAIHDDEEDESEKEAKALRVAAKNIAALDVDGLMNVIDGTAGAGAELRKNFLLIAEKLKAA